MPNKGHRDDQPSLFPELASGVSEAPLSPERIDEIASAIAAAADRREVIMVDVSSEAAQDQGFVHETPTFGLRRPTAEEIEAVVETPLGIDDEKPDYAAIAAHHFPGIMESLKNRKHLPRF